MLIGDSASGDPSARLQEETREFAGRYERHAYLVYNLALRITCERHLASAAAERTFLEHAGKPADEDVLAAAVVGIALASARLRPRPSGAGGGEEERLLAAVAGLAPKERAAVALAVMRGAGTHEVARTLALDEPAADALLRRGFEGVATALATTPAATRIACDEWLWAAPPGQLWEAMYPKFYRAAERMLRSAGAEAGDQPTQVLPRLARTRRLAPRLRFGLLLLLPVLVAGGAVGLLQLRGGESADATAGPTYADVQSEPTNPPVASPVPAVGAGAVDEDDDEARATRPRRKPLTPRELDQLRRNELRMLELYTKRETDRRLSKTERDFAGQKVSLLRDLARRRIEADRRERELARAERRNSRRERELERERRRLRRGDGGSAPRQREEPSTTAPAPSPKPPPSETEDSQDCLYNAEDGTYICQE